MKLNTPASIGIALSIYLPGVILTSPFAHADRLYVGPDQPLILHIAADTLLWSHIGGGLIGMLAGIVALASRKGRNLHRKSGLVFLWAMAVTYFIGAGVAPFLETGQRPNFVAGILALYLLSTGVLTVKKPKIRSGLTVQIGLPVAMGITAMGLFFMWIGTNSPTGTVDGSPPQAFLLFTIAGTAACLGDLNVLIRKQLSGPARLARHLWRMCTSFFIASGSFFLGQPQVFPEAFNASPFPYLLSFAPLIAIAVWLILVRRKPHAQKSA